MSVYLDSQGHLVADSREELHAFAARIGLRREWFQDRPRLWHYDVITASKRRRAVAAGAAVIRPRQAVAILNRATRLAGPVHEPHYGNHVGYACGFAAPHCWTCEQPWPCPASVSLP